MIKLSNNRSKYTTEIQERWKDKDTGILQGSRNHDFISSLAYAECGLSEKQVYWIHKMSTRCWPKEFTMDEPVKSVVIHTNSFNDLSKFHEQVKESKGYWLNCWVNYDKRHEEVRFTYEEDGVTLCHSRDTRQSFGQDKRNSWCHVGEVKGNKFDPYYKQYGIKQVRAVLGQVDGKRLTDVFPKVRKRKVAECYRR